jgi:hypothetical protein
MKISFSVEIHGSSQSMFSPQVLKNQEHFQDISYQSPYTKKESKGKLTIMVIYNLRGVQLFMI